MLLKKHFIVNDVVKPKELFYIAMDGTPLEQKQTSKNKEI